MFLPNLTHLWELFLHDMLGSGSPEAMQVRLALAPFAYVLLCYVCWSHLLHTSSSPTPPRSASGRRPGRRRPRYDRRCSRPSMWTIQRLPWLTSVPSKCPSSDSNSSLSWKLDKIQIWKASWLENCKNDRFFISIKGRINFQFTFCLGSILPLPIEPCIPRMFIIKLVSLKYLGWVRGIEYLGGGDPRAWHSNFTWSPSMPRTSGG